MADELGFKTHALDVVFEDDDFRKNTWYIDLGTSNENGDDSQSDCMASKPNLGAVELCMSHTVWICSPAREALRTE